MDISPLHSSQVKAANLSLDRLADSKQVPESEKIKEVSRAFEAVLLRQILSESQRPVFKSESTGNPTTEGIYRDMVVNQLAEDISKSGSFGVGKNLAGEMQHQLLAKTRHAAPKHLNDIKLHIKTQAHE